MHTVSKIAIISCLMAHLTIGCVAYESDETSEQSINTDITRGDDAIPFEASMVLHGDYDVISLAPTISESIRNSVLASIKEAHGDEVLVWTVQEEDGPHHVFAYPRDGYDLTGETDGRVDSRLDGLQAKLRSTIMPAKGPQILVNTCHSLWQYAWTCNGASFSVCGQQGTSSSTGRLANYGFDNYASCYLTGNTSNAVYVYDGNYQNYPIGLIQDDWWSFDSTFNNMASSLINYF